MSVIYTDSGFMKKIMKLDGRDFRLPPREVSDICAVLGYCSAYGEDGTDRLSENFGKELPPYAA